MTYTWLRLYVEVVHDRKIRRLRAELRWFFVATLCAARESSQPGSLMVGATPMTDNDLADYAGLSLRTTRAGLKALVAAGLLARRDDCWFVPKWDERQFESDFSTERVKRHRERKRNVSETPPDTETDTETEREGARPVDNPEPGTVRALVQSHFETRSKRIPSSELDALADDLEREGFTVETVGELLGTCAYPSDVRHRLKSLMPAPTKSDESYGYRPSMLERCPVCNALLGIDCKGASEHPELRP